jgi:hypothetical protein
MFRVLSSSIPVQLAPILVPCYGDAAPSGVAKSEGDAMDLLILAHLVSSYEDWKVIFDEDVEARKAFVSGETRVGQADANTAMIVFYGVDMEAMAAFLGTPEFAERTAKLVSGHTLYSLSELPPPA